jgi:hypothetical protein
VTSADVRLTSAQTQACATFHLADTRCDLWSGNPKTLIVTAKTETNAVKFMWLLFTSSLPIALVHKIEILQNSFHSFLHGAPLVSAFLPAGEHVQEITEWLIPKLRIRKWAPKVFPFCT